VTRDPTEPRSLREGFHRAHRWELEWQDDAEVLTLGQGVQVKILYRDAGTQHTDMLIKFPPGYVEPRHAHDSVHSVIVLEGLQVAEGEHMHPGDYVFGGANTPHGPFEYPEGCVVFASFRGPSSQHRYEGSPAGDM
jgi:anti-sigma factor ChrR (cupin superfamily)